MRTLTRPPRVRSALILVALAAGCDAGNDAPPGTFTEIYETLFPPTTPARCGFCHSMPASDVSNGNLSTGTDQAAAYAALVEQTSTSSRCAGKPLVVPFHAEQSLLLDKLTGEPACGELMPLGGMALSDAELEVVRSWIDAGAKND